MERGLTAVGLLLTGIQAHTTKFLRVCVCVCIVAGVMMEFPRAHRHLNTTLLLPLNGLTLHRGHVQGREK